MGELGQMGQNETVDLNLKTPAVKLSRNGLKCPIRRWKTLNWVRNLFGIQYTKHQYIVYWRLYWRHNIWRYNKNIDTLMVKKKGLRKLTCKY